MRVAGGEVGRAEWGETIHNLGVNHTIKNGFGIRHKKAQKTCLNRLERFMTKKVIAIAEKEV